MRLGTHKISDGLYLISHDGKLTKLGLERIEAERWMLVYHDDDKRIELCRDQPTIEDALELVSCVFQAITASRCDVLS